MSEAYALLWGGFALGSWVAVWLLARGITRELRGIREELSAERASAWLANRWKAAAQSSKSSKSDKPLKWRYKVLSE